MAELNPQRIGASIKSLLQVPGGVTSALTTVEDGDGNPTCFELSSAGAKVNGDLEVTGSLVGSTTLSDEAPENLGGATSGSSNSASRADHVHFHGNLAGGSLHSVASTSVAGFMSAADKTKLDGVADGATANATNAQLRDRSTHTGTQAISTVSGLQTALDGKLATGGDGSAVTVATTAGAPTTRTLADRAEDYVSKDTSLTSRVTVGTAQAATSTTITLAAGNAAVDDMFNNLDIVVTGGTGAGQTRRISDYVGSTRVATVTVAWTTTPDATSTYEIRVPAGSVNQANRWRWKVKNWTSNIGNGGGGRWVCEYDTSAAGDWSSTEETMSMSRRSGPGMNGNDGEMYLHQQVVHIVSTNDLRNPPTPQNNDVVSGAAKTGTSSSPLDVGPQVVVHRDINNPPVGSALGQIMFTGNSDVGTGVRYGEFVLEVRDPTSTTPKGRLRTQVATAPTFGGGSKSAWSVGSDGCTTWKPSGGADTQPTGGEKGEGTINAFELYDNGNRVAVTSGSNQAVLTTTGATNVTLPTTGTLATLSGSETLSNKTLASPTTSGNLRVGTTSGAMDLFSGGDGNGYFQLSTTGVISFRTGNGGASQMRIVHTASANTTVDITGANSGNPGIGASGNFLAFTSPVVDKSYTVATLPTAANAGGFIYVSNESGGAVPAFSDGTNWRRVTDRAVVS
jgi:hypothetical protein